MSNLYVINEQMRIIDNFLDNQELAETDKDYLESVKKVLTEDMVQNAEAIYKYIKETETRIEAKKNEEKRLYDLRKAEENKIIRLKELIKESMNILGEKKIETNLGYFSIRKNPLKVNILDEEKIPKEFIEVKTVESVNKKELLNRFKETGELIDGVSFEQGESLQIR